MKVDFNILEKFILKEDYIIREKLLTPFLYGDSVIASNGHILIQVPLKDVVNYPAIGLKDESEFVRDIINKIRPNCNFNLDLSTIPKYKTKPRYEECPFCEGYGYEFESDGTECSKCKGAGYTDKQIGTERESSEFYKIEDAYFNPDYIKFIHENFPYLWNVITVDRAKAMKMICENVVILLMPMRYDYVEIMETTSNIYKLTKE